MPLQKNIIHIILSFVVATLLMSTSFSQTNLSAKQINTDSLKNLLSKDLPENEKIEVLIQLFDIYRDSLPSKALEYGHMAFDLDGDKRRKATIMFRLGRLFLNNNYYEKAESYYKQEYEIYKQLYDDYRRDDDYINMARCFKNLGIIYNKTKDYKKAIQYYDKALKIFNALDGISLEGLYTTLYNKALTYSDYLNDYDKALACYIQAMQVSEKIYKNLGEDAKKSERRQALIRYGDGLNNLGWGYYKASNLKEALSCYKKALEIYKKEESGYAQGYVLNTMGNMARIHLELKDYESASNYLNKVIVYAKEVNDIKRIHEISELLMKLHKETNNITKYDEYSKLYFAAEKNISIDEKTIILADLQSKYELNIKENDLQIVKKENEIKANKQRFIYAISISVIILVLLFIVFRLKQSKLKQKNLVVEKKLLNEQLVLKNKELVSKILFLTKNNELFTNINTKLTRIKYNLQKKKNQQDIDEIISELKMNQNQNVWNEFEASFNHIYTDYYSNLSNKFANLTSQDLKYCALLKLNLSSKEIAAITYKDVRTIEVARSRIRTKLNLSSDDNLTNFLNRF